MRDVFLEAMRGAAAVVDGFPVEYDADWHSRAQISRGDWEIIKCLSAWTPEQVRGARTAIDKLLSACLTQSGLPRMPLPAEYIATVISKVISPANWMASAQAGLSGLDGKQLVSQQGDVISAREAVTPERLFALILLFYDDSNTRVSGQPTEESLAMQEAWHDENKGKASPK